MQFKIFTRKVLPPTYETTVCWFVEGGVTDTGWRSRKILTGHELPAVLCDREESTLLLWPGNVLRAPGGRERRTEPRMPKHLQTITIIDD